MPSGAKKRKAAKKKKEQEANIISSTNTTHNNTTPLGNDDPKSQDERESDGGDSGSPASQDHHNQQHPFNKGNGDSEKIDPSTVPPFDTDKKSSGEIALDIEGTAKVGAEDNGAVKIRRELESEDILGGQDISIKHVEFSNESHGGSSSSNSSDNESQAVEKPSKKAIQSTGKWSFGKADDSVVETAPAIDSDKPLVTVAKEAINVTKGNSYENSLAPDLVESRLKENTELTRNEDDVLPITEESVEVSWTVVEPVTKENAGKSLPLSAAPESGNGSEIRDSKIAESSVNQPLLAPAPRVEQRTSWMSCCGLFDVLTGSGR